MSALAQQQQVLLQALFAWPAQNAMKKLADYAMDTGARGIKAYQANGHALAERALGAAYPVVAQLLGQDSFADLARAFWHAHPPVRGDVAQWGAELPSFLSISEQLANEPYLPDIALVEWALHQSASAQDAQADLPSLALLTTMDPAELVLRLTPGCAVVRSAWPIASIMGAHREQSPTFTEVGAQLRDGVAQDAVVWRAGLRPAVRQTIAGEAQLLDPLSQGQALAVALEAAPALDFAAWLPMAIQTRLLLGVQLLSKENPV